MKRTLVILRHAQAEPFGIVSSDFERTLIPKGVQTVQYTAKELKKIGFIPQIMVASAAPRAFYTLRIVAEILGADSENITPDQALYAGTEQTLLNTIRKFPDDKNSAIVCGHNPAVSNLIAELCGESVITAQLFPADIAVLEFESESWALTGDVPVKLLKLIHKPGVH